MEVKISTEKYDVISTGSVYIPYGEYIEFAIEQLRFRIVIIEEEDANNPNGEMTMKVEEDEEGQKIMLISLSNFHDTIMATPTRILKLARLNGRDLCLAFSITSVNKSTENKTEDKILFYTWFHVKDTITDGSK